MKKILYIGILLFINVLTSNSQEKKTTLFRFIFSKESNNKKVLFQNNNNVELKRMSSEEFSLENGYLESFIIKPSDNRGNVFIISAKSPRFYLKRNSNSENSKLSFSEKEAGVDSNLYTWQILKAGNSKDEIAFQTSEVRQLGIHVSKNNVISLKYFIDSQNKRLSNTIENKPLGEFFLFKKETLTNVF